MMDSKHTGPKRGYKHQIKNSHRDINQKRHFKKEKSPLIIPAIIIISVIGLVGFASITNFGQVTTGGQDSLDGDNDGYIAGDFSLQDVHSISEYKMSDYQGSLILIDFMSRDCSFCQYSYPFLERVHDTYPQVEIFTVTIDTASDSVADMIVYSRDYAISWHVARDIYGISSSKFQVLATPTTVLINKDFNVVEQQSGVLDFETMQGWITDWL